jgi:hypothetical protein
MYVRFLSARYGRTASASARKMARSLEQKGNRRGHEIWNDIAEAIKKFQRDKSGTLRHKHEEAALAGGLFLYHRPVPYCDLDVWPITCPRLVC